MVLGFLLTGRAKLNDATLHFCFVQLNACINFNDFGTYKLQYLNQQVILCEFYLNESVTG